nr:uncharacterized mitochondrial protein AtMg00810-like [Tanacetum cinerariifolium]
KEGKDVDSSHYHGMIGTLLYLTASRPDLQFAICMCARYQARPIEKHVHAVKRIFRYLRGTVHRGLWYPKDSSVSLTAFVDADHAGCQDTRRSTSGSVQFLGERLISWSSKRQKSAAISSTKAVYRDNVSSPESAPTFAELFEINDLKAQVQEKDTVILKLKEKIKSFSGDDKERKAKREVEEIETQNLELDHKVTKLVAENEHLKQTYKQLFDSIKSSHVKSKEKCDDLINKVNLKSVEVSELNASLQEKVLVDVAPLVPKLSVSLNPIDPALLQVDVAPLVPKLRRNRTAHTDYIRHTQEEAATLREIVESERLLSPLNTSLDYA